MHNKKAYLLIFMLILLARLSLAAVIAEDEDAAISPDSFGYISLADNIVYHGQYHIDGETTLDLFRTPGYPAFLALIFYIFAWIQLLSATPAEHLKNT